MTVVTAEKLSATVGAEIVGVDRRLLLEDEALPAWTLARHSRTTACWSFGTCTSTTPPRSPSPGGSVRVETFGSGEFPEIFRVTLDPTKNPAAAYLRGTFDWHIDGCTDDVPIMATVLAAHAVAESGGETEFASTYAAYDDLTDEEKQRFGSLRVVHTIEASQRLVNDDPSPEEVALWRTAAIQGAPAGVDPPVGTTLAGPRGHHVPRGPAWTATRDGPSSTTCWPDRRPLDASTGTSGRSGTW